MAEAITDEYVIRVLRPFVRANRPVLRALRDADPLGLRRRAQDDRLPKGVLRKLRMLLAAAKVPGTPTWAAMKPDARCDWWANRVSRFVALVAAVPGVGGMLADRLPLQDTLGVAGQGLMLCAIAGEYGIEDENEQIRLLAHVLLNRDVDAELAARTGSDEDADAKAAELTAELDESERKHGGRPTLGAIAGTMWRLGRALWSLGDEVGKRPQGRFYHKMFGWLPLVGVVGDYFGERHALRKVARAGRSWIIARREPASEV